MPIDQRPAKGQPILLRHKQNSVGGSSSIALLAGLSSAEAQFFNWFGGFSSRL